MDLPVAPLDNHTISAQAHTFIMHAAISYHSTQTFGSFCRYRGTDYVLQKKQYNQMIKPPGELVLFGSFCFFCDNGTCRKTQIFNMNGVESCMHSKYMELCGNTVVTKIFNLLGKYNK